MTLIDNPSDAIVFAPGVTIDHDTVRAPWSLPDGKKLAVSLLLHAPAYQDTVPSDAHKPMSMAGGVGRETSEPRHGQVARLSQWDFGLTVGIFRLMKIAADQKIPIALAVDSLGVRAMPGFADAIADLPVDIVCRGMAANNILDPSMSGEEALRYIAEAKGAVEAATGRTSTGWFGPERGATFDTPSLLSASGFEWFGDWPADERPISVGGGSITAVPFGIETEDMFALYTRGLSFADYEVLLNRTVDQLLSDADTYGARFLGLSWFGWVLGQACFADVAERFLARLAGEPDIVMMSPGAVARL
jgi:allantoinase